MSASVRRKLTAILAADADGYSRAMEADEVRAMAALQAARRVFAGLIERHHGRIANTAGDGLIAEFGSVVEAVQCAIEVLRELGADPDSALRFRIGVHLGAKGRSHQARAARPAARAAGAGELKPRIMRLLRVFGAIVAVLFAIDLATGGPMWRIGSR